MSKPAAVCISDIHFNLTTLPIASKALISALAKAQRLDVPLIIAGDLNDTKAIIRAEVANAIISILKPATVDVYILEGNHDKVNEKGSEHGLNYLRPYATIVDRVLPFSHNITFIPYQNDSDKLKEILSIMPKQEILIMHQGFLGAAMGDYIQDKTSIDPELVKGFTVISGHYHRHQTIGTVTYIGSPYTITFGEANDGPKGFLIVNSDGTFTREILNLRRHRIREVETKTLSEHLLAFGELWCRENDLLWVKIKGPYSELQTLNKEKIGAWLLCGNNFRLDLIPDDSNPSESVQENLTDIEQFDRLIDNLKESDTQKQYMKTLWKELYETSKSRST